MKKLLILTMTLLIAGCAAKIPFLEQGTTTPSAKPETPTEAQQQAEQKAAPRLTVQLVASKGVNPNSLGDASPVVVRLYQLKGRKLFDSIGFIDLYEDDGVLLQGELVHIRELDPLAPGKSTRVELPVYMSTRYVAVMAAFSDYESGKPLDLIWVDPNKPQKLKVLLRGNKVRLIKLK